MSECPHPHDLQSFVDGEIYGEEAARIREHLKHCPACAARVEAYEQVRYTLLRARRVRPAEDLLERILSLLRRVGPVPRLSCREARVLASAYIDDELSLEERETLETHLFACDDCFAQYAQMRDAAGIMRATPPAEVAASLKDRILVAVAAEAAATEPAPVLRPRHTAAAPWYRALGPALATAAAVMFAFGVFQLTRGVEGQPGTPAELVAGAPAPLVADAAAPPQEDTQPAAAPVVAVAPPTQPRPTDAPVAAQSPVEPSASAPTGPADRPGRPAPHAAVRRPEPEPRPAERVRSVRPNPAPTMVASVGRSAETAATAANDDGGGAHLRLATTGRSRSEAPARPKTTSTHAPAPAPLRGPTTGGADGAAKLTRPAPRPSMVALEETSEDDLQPTEWVEKRPETSTRLYSHSGDNGPRLAAASSKWTHAGDTDTDAVPDLSDETWPTN